MASEQPRSGDKNRAKLRDALSRYEQSHAGSRARPPSRIAQRRDAIHAEIERNRRADHAVPTWVLGGVLMLMVVGIVLFIVFG